MSVLLPILAMALFAVVQADFIDTYPASRGSLTRAERMNSVARGAQAP